MAVNAAQHQIMNLFKTLFFFAHQFSLVFVYLMCGPRQLFSQCGPETPKGWTPLWASTSFAYHHPIPDPLCWPSIKRILPIGRKENRVNVSG